MFCAAIAVVGGYSCAQAQTKRGTDDQTALAVPRIALNGSPGVAMPQPLSPGEAARVRHIFALQAGGAIQEAVRETALLDNKLLLGSILADRYLGEWGHPTATDLTDWLASYGDQPDAPAIRALRTICSSNASDDQLPCDSDRGIHGEHPSAVGGDGADVGFTGSTGGETATQNVLSWTYAAP